MGYTTWFDGTLQFNRPVTEVLKDKINDFAKERHEGQDYPGYWCQWIINDDGELEWDGGEKFYHYDEWLRYLIHHFFEPEGYILNGDISFNGEDDDDLGIIHVVDNEVNLEYGICVYSMEDISDEDLLEECRKRNLIP